MKFSTVLVATAIAGSVSASKGPKVTSRTTVTVTWPGSTNTHKYGRFDKTTRSTTTSTGTHKYGRFDKTSRSHTTSTGTHKYGRFDKTHQPVTTTIYDADATGVDYGVAYAVANSSSNSTSNSSSNSTSSTVDNAGANFGAAPMMGVAGALAAGMLLL